jgi:carboxymethylenebutenolidase
VTRAGRVQVLADGRAMRATLAVPDGDGPFPGVIVIHEALGLTRDIKEKCLRLAEMGYAAIAADLFDGRGPMPICIFRTIGQLNDGDGPAFADLDATREYLAARPEVDGSRIGVIGFCMGGGFALPNEAERLTGVCPVVAGYGGRDRVFGKQADRLEQHLTALRVPHDVRVYPDAGHSYMSDHKGLLARVSSWGPMKVGYNPDAAEDSWRRVEAFFGEHLGLSPRSE